MATKPTKTTCPYCARRIALTSTGKLRRHLTKRGGPVCGRSGGRPN